MSPAAPASSPLVRPLAAGDRDGWESLYRGYLAFYERPADPGQIERAWTRLLAGDELHALVAIDGDGDRLVGIVHYLFHANVSGDDVCYLQDLFTDPDARGRGVARALIAAVVDAARAHDAARVYWLTHESNATARRLYDAVAAHRGFLRYEIDL